MCMWIINNNLMINNGLFLAIIYFDPIKFIAHFYNLNLLFNKAAFHFMKGFNSVILESKYLKFN